MANGQIQVEIVDTQKALEGIDEIKKQISEMVGANKVLAIYEYAWALSGNYCEQPGFEIEVSELPVGLQQIIGDDMICENLLGIIQEWAELKGYGHSESKQGNTKG